MRRAASMLMVTALVGCTEYVNPWMDEYPGPEAVSTASVDGIRARGATPELRTRESKQSQISPQDGTVMHFPLWWEDPMEDKGSDDGQFAWTWEDYVAMPYSYGRVFLNTIAVPVSAVVQPPVPRMASDGVLSKQALGYDHDAEWVGTRGKALPPDIVETGAATPATANGHVPVAGKEAGSTAPAQPARTAPAAPVQNSPPKPMTPVGSNSGGAHS